MINEKFAYTLATADREFYYWDLPGIIALFYLPGFTGTTDETADQPDC